MLTINPAARRLVADALKEDLNRLGDVTTKLFVPAGARFKGRIVAKAQGVICGTGIAAAVFKAVDKDIKVKILKKDGSRITKGTPVMAVNGGRGILTAERTALNFLQRMSGVSTLAAAYVSRTRGTRARIYDTRKTIPGWRRLDKYAAKCGGASNHRLGLYDAVMVKDNHWTHGSLSAGVAALRRLRPRMILEIEADTLSQAKRALTLGADVVLLDNMSRRTLRTAIRFIRAAAPRVKIEISGGVTLKTVRTLAKLDPDRISVGALTHSAPALDLSLELLR